MDAAVWSPQMTDVDCNGNAVNAELEVKKLQELVRKLEKQNEQLRTRASGCTSPHILSPSPVCALGKSLGPGGYCLPSPLTTLLRQASLGSFFSVDEPFEYFHPHAADPDAEGNEPTVLDEVEVLDLDVMLPSDASDYSWLYVPSKARAWGDSSAISPLQWCRQVLDSPRGEVEAARRSLCLRLDQVSRWRGGFSTPPSAAPLSRVAGVTPLSASFTKSCSTPTSSAKPVSFSTPFHPLHLPLSPVGKALPAPSERTPTFLRHPADRSHSLRQSVLSPQSSLDSELSASELEDDSITLGYKLQDLTDVQVMARLQEDSLRQAYATTTSSASTLSRRSASFSFQPGPRGSKSHVEEDEEDEEEDYGLPPPQPRLSRAGPFQHGLPHSQTFSSMRDWRRSTSTLTPPSTPPNPTAGLVQALASPTASPTASPYMSRQGLRSISEYENKLRKSMPNLVRAPSIPSMLSPANHFGSPSLLRNSQSFDSSNGLSRLQSSIPSPGELQTPVQSTGNFQMLSRQPLKATAYVSPTTKGSVSMPTSASLQSLSSGGNERTPLPIPSPGQLQLRVRSVGNFEALSRQPVKATAYVSPTIKGSVSMPTSASLQSLSSGNGGIPSKPSLGGASPTPSRPSGLPRPASFMGTSSTPTRSKIAQPARSLLTPPRSLSTLSALRDGSWKDGCY